METRISSSSMDNANKIKTSVMLLLLYGICIFPAWDGNLSVLLGLFAVSSILCMLTRGFMPNRFIVDGENRGCVSHAIHPLRLKLVSLYTKCAETSRRTRWICTYCPEFPVTFMQHEKSRRPNCAAERSPA